MPDGQIILAAQTVVTMLRWRGAEPHPALATTPTWYDDTALARLDRAARDELAEHGLVDGRGLDAGLAAIVEAMAQPRAEYFGWVTTSAESTGELAYSVLAAAAGRTGFVAVRMPSTDRVSIAAADPGRLLMEFMGEIPELAAARGNSASVPRADYEAAGVDDRERRPGAGPPTPQLAAIERVLGMRRSGNGSLYSARRDRAGVRRRASYPVNYLDTVSGRWLTEVTTYGADRTEWVTIAPATHDLLATRLSERHDRLPA